MNTNIRKAQTSDAGGLAHLLRSLGWFHRLDDETIEQTTYRVQAHLDLNLADDSHSIYIAAAEDGAFLGYCAVHWLPYLFLQGPEGYISELFILEHARGQGLGGRMLEAVEQEARARGCSRLQLLNGRDRESYRRGFYTKHGYEERDMAPFLKRLSA